MRYLMSPGDRLFEAFLGDMRNFTDPDFTESVKRIPRASVRSMDYLITHSLDNNTRNTEKSVLTRRGWTFISTSIGVLYTGSAALAPLVRIRQDEVANGGLSGGPKAAFPPENPLTLGWLDCQNGFGPGSSNPNPKILTEQRAFFRYFGESASIETHARLNALDVSDRTVHILVTGWEVRNYG